MDDEDPLSVDEELSVLLDEPVSVEETLLSVDEEDPVSVDDELDEPGSVDEELLSVDDEDPLSVDEELSVLLEETESVEDELLVCR